MFGQGVSPEQEESVHDILCEKRIDSVYSYILFDLSPVRKPGVR